MDTPAAKNCDTGQTLLSCDDALQQLLNDVIPVTAVEQVDTLETLGRVLAQTLTAPFSVPEADNSAMDGFAVRFADIETHQKPLVISQRIAAGHLGQPLAKPTAARIFTGALIPQGADTVVMQEHCHYDQHNVTFSPHQAQTIKRGANIRRCGEDIQQGSTLLEKGQRLRPQDMGLAASMGLATLPVFRKLRVATLFTGDELQSPGETRQAGKIYNSNRFTVIGLLQQLGCEVIDLGNVCDDPNKIRDALLQASQRADLILSSGGVSVGEEDHMREVIASIGELRLWRIAIKPGKPLAYGRINDVPFIGLPGNPVSTFVTFCLYVRPFIMKSQGRHKLQPDTLRAQAGFERQHPSKRREYLRAKITMENDTPLIRLYPHQGSGVLSSTSWADGLVCIPEGTTVSNGQYLDYTSFAEMA